MDQDPGASLNGDLYVYPFGCRERSKLVAEHYSSLADTYGSDGTLCLTRLCKEDDIADEISGSTDIGSTPSVRTVSGFATEILRTLLPDVDTLSDHERIELLSDYLSRHDWETDYLADAARRESFQRDVGELLIDIESKGYRWSSSYFSPALQELAAVSDGFQAYMEEHGYVDEPSIVPRAIEELSRADTDAVPDIVTKWDAVLIADFEECGPIQRRLLEAVSKAGGTDLVGIAERHRSLLSTWREAGTIESASAGLDVIPQTDKSIPTTAPVALARYLTTGNRPRVASADGEVRVIEAPTFRVQISRVADEIEWLCRTKEYSYSDVAIAYQDSKAPIGKTIRLLRRYGIPTTTVAVKQLSDDPAVRELYDLTKACTNETEIGEQGKSADRLLEIERATEELLIETRDSQSLASGLWQWIGDTQLKHRIADEYGELDARDQFRRVREVIELAEFLDGAPPLQGTWDALLQALERAFRYSSARFEGIGAGGDTGGVPIGTIYGLKHASYKAVFLLNVTDQAYPSVPELTPLFPTSRLREEPNFPLLTTQTPEDVSNTFQPAPAEADDPFHEYFSQVSRRLLGTAAAVASERLYFGVPREGTDRLGTFHQPSRYLEELVNEFPFISPHDTGDGTLTASHGGAGEFVVEHVDETLESVRRASIGGESVDLDEYERELVAIEALLANPSAEEIVDALEARVDFRQGRVRRV